jgi:hypothetical protein
MPFQAVGPALAIRVSERRGHIIVGESLRTRMDELVQQKRNRT